MNYFLLLNEQQAGPYSEDQVHALITAGTVLQTDLCWHEGMAEWQPLKTLEKFAQVTSAIPPPPPRLHSAQNGGFEFPKILALLGSVLLVFGVFTPAASLPMLGGVNFLKVGWPAYGVLVLAATSLMLVFIDRAKMLWITGGMATLVLLGCLGKFLYALYQLQQQFAVKPDGNNPFDAAGAVIGKAMIKSIQLQWGCAILVLGVGFILAGAFYSSPSTAQRRPKGILSLVAALLAIGALGAGIFYSYKSFGEHYPNEVQANKIAAPNASPAIDAPSIPTSTPAPPSPNASSPTSAPIVSRTATLVTSIPPSTPSQLTIIKAIYGAGDIQRDVTALIAGMVHGTQFQMRVGNDTLGGSDPYAGKVKILTVLYRNEGGDFTVTAQEGSQLIIPNSNAVLTAPPSRSTVVDINTARKLPKSCPNITLPLKGQEFVTTEGDKYTNATVLRIEPDGVVISDDDGIRKLKFVKLPPDVGRKFGYDPQEASQFQADQHAAEVNRENELLQAQRNALAQASSQVAQTPIPIHQVHQQNLPTHFSIRQHTTGNSRHAYRNFESTTVLSHNYEILSYDSQGVEARREDGVVERVPYQKLPTDIRKAYGYPPPSSTDGLSL